MIILLSLTSLRLQWKTLCMCCIFNDLSYSASEVILWWNAIRFSLSPPPPTPSSLSLSLSHRYTHTHIHTPSGKHRHLPENFLMYCSLNGMTFCLHRKLDTRLFSLETVSETYFPHWFFSIWHTYVPLTYLMFGRHGD